MSNRIHPLLAVAAVSVTLVSLVGIAAITDLLPKSYSSGADSAAKTGLAVPASTPVAPVAQSSPVGIGVGAVVGGLLGDQVGGGNGKTLTTIAGALRGGYLGKEVARKNQ